MTFESIYLRIKLKIDDEDKAAPYYIIYFSIFSYLTGGCSHSQYICSSEQLLARAEICFCFSSLFWNRKTGWGVVWCGVVWCGVVWCGGVVSLTFPGRSRHTLEVAARSVLLVPRLVPAWYKRSHRYHRHSCTLTVVASQTKHEILCKYFSPLNIFSI